MKEKYTAIMAKIALVIAIVTVVLYLTHLISTKAFTLLIIVAFIIWGICTYLEGTHRKRGDKSSWIEVRRNALRGKKKK